MTASPVFIPELSRGRFLDWCRSNGLERNESVASVFHVTAATVRNWESTRDQNAPAYLLLCAKGYEAWKVNQASPLPALPAPSHDWFLAWCRRNGFATQAAAARALGQARQTVSQWIDGNSFPAWLPLACLGFEVVRDGMAEFSDMV